MSEIKHNFSINAFPGSKTHGLAWPAMKRHLIDVARGIYINTQDHLGIVAYLVNEAKYSEIHFMYHGRLPTSGTSSPTSSMSSLSISASTSPAVKKYTFPKMPDQTNFDLTKKDVLNQYKFLMKNWQEEVNAVEIFRAKLLAALDEIALSALGTADERVNLQLREIYEGLDLRFSTIFNSDLRRELKRIRDPIATITNFDSVIKLHTDIHQLCEDQNTPLSENQKIIELQSSLENFPCFEIQNTLFDSNFEIKDSKRTFKTLAGNCLKHWNNLGDKGTGNTAGSHGYTNPAKAQKKNSTSSPNTGLDLASGPSVEDRLTRGFEEIKTYLLAAKDSKAPEAGKSKRKKVYCDNHGWGGHETSDCRGSTKKAPKHPSHSFPNLKNQKGKNT
jgi:hypothetical protein